MKTIVKYLVFVSIVTNSIFTACVSKRQIAVSNARIESLKQDSIRTHQVLAHKLKNADKKHVTSSPKSTSRLEHFTPLPPSKVDSVFRAHYREATNVIWANYQPNNHLEAHGTHEYQVHFELHEKKESVVYSDEGKMIEVRSEILPDQLPDIVYKAIKSKYADEQIVEAYAYTSIYSDGTYVAVLKSNSQAMLHEQIVSEKGLIVK